MKFSSNAWFAVLGCAFIAGVAVTERSTAETPPAPSVTAAPLDPEAAAAAVALMEAIGAGKNFENLLSKLKTHVATANPNGATAEANGNAFEKLAAKFTDYKKRMTDETVAVYADNFTAAELRAVTAFYKSAAGAKFIAKMPEVMEQASGIGQKYAIEMMKDLKAAKDAQSPAAPQSAP